MEKQLQGTAMRNIGRVEIGVELKNPDNVPAGWYPSPFSRQPGVQRWWDGHEWTKEVRTVVDAVSNHETSSEPAAVALDGQLPVSVVGPVSESQRNAGLILAALTLIFLVFNFGIFVIGLLELLCAVALVAVATKPLVHRLRAHARPVSIFVVEIALGVCGIGWFVWTAIKAASLYVEQR